MVSPLLQLLRIDGREVEFSRRGFTCTSAELRERLENIGRVFLHGYRAALEHRDQNVLEDILNQVELEQRGFTYEGAAMALALQDRLLLRRNALGRWMKGAGRKHIFMLHVGAGWAYARLGWLRRRLEPAITRFDPVLRWLVIDGYGFHEGYFHWKRRPGPEVRSLTLSENTRHVFFQGLGRSLWFVKGANVGEISAAIASFHPTYRGDAWSGAGLACAYAGGLTADAIVHLRHEAGIHPVALAQGAAFAAKTRQLAGNPAAHTEIACQILCGMPAARAALLCDETYSRINMLHPCPYQHWRKLLQEALLSYAQMFKRGKPHESSISSSLAPAQPY